MHDSPPASIAAEPRNGAPSPRKKPWTPPRVKEITEVGDVANGHNHGPMTDTAYSPPGGLHHTAS